MKNKHQGTFVVYDKSLKMNDVLPMFSFLGLSDNEIAVFLGMRPESPYAEKYIANKEQELNHLQLYACRSMDQALTAGISQMDTDAFLQWIHTPNSMLGNQPPRELLLDINGHDTLLEALKE